MHPWCDQCWASVESYSPQLPPMATSLSRVKYHSGRVGGGSCLAHTSATLHRSVSLLWLSSSSGAHRWFGWLAQVSPDNVKYSLMQLDEVNIEGLSPGGVVWRCACVWPVNHVFIDKDWLCELEFPSVPLSCLQCLLRLSALLRRPGIRQLYWERLRRAPCAI